MPITYSIVKAGDEPFLTVLVPGEAPKVARADHPNYDKIVALVTRREEPDSQELKDLFDVAQSITRRFERLSERVTVLDGELYLDGTVMDNALSKQVLRFLDEGVDDWEPLVKFYEKVITNPQDHSRKQLYSWLDKRDFTITDEGDIVAYKGVRKESDGCLRSLSTGYGIVDGVEHEWDHLPNNIGSIVEMPREMVVHNPSEGCSIGLHVGSHEYAMGYGNVLLEIHVNPRDVVSVPTDSGWAKVRCCRYVVIGEIERHVDSEYRSAVIDTYYDDDDDDDSARCFECGEYYGECDCDICEECELPTEDCECYLPGCECDIEDEHACQHDQPCECSGTCQPEPEFEYLGPAKVSYTSISSGINVYALPPITNPTQQEWEAMEFLAHRMKKSVKAIAPARGWTLIAFDGSQRTHWSV